MALSRGEIAGIVIGVLLALLIIGMLFGQYKRRRSAPMLSAVPPGDHFETQALNPFG